MTIPTPFISQHAKDRCAEMGISTKVAKRIWQRRDTVFPGRQTRSKGTQAVVAYSDEEPNYGVVVVPGGGPDGRDAVVTVTFRTGGEYYRREGDSYVPLTKDEYVQYRIEQNKDIGDLVSFTED